MAWGKSYIMALPEFREPRGFDDLKNLQRIADEHVDHMKEGTYLEVCGHHKSLFDEYTALFESNTKLYDLWQAEKNRVNVPFQARVGLPLDPETFVRVNEEWVENSEALGALRADLGVAERSLKNLKPIVRITQRIRGSWTWQNLTQHYESMFWFETETEHNNFVSGLNERQIYQDYKRRFNEKVERATQEARALKINLEREIKRVERRMALLTMTLNHAIPR
jgi:hypothetical protein